MLGLSSFSRRSIHARRSLRLIGSLSLCGGALVLCFVSQAVRAQDDAEEIARGEHLARMICSNCHQVADDQVYTKLRQTTPSFRQIANMPKTNEERIQHFVATTHWDGKRVPITMPQLSITPEQTVAVSKYVMSLRSPLPHP